MADDELADRGAIHEWADDAGATFADLGQQVASIDAASAAAIEASVAGAAGPRRNARLDGADLRLVGDGQRLPLAVLDAAGFRTLGDVVRQGDRLRRTKGVGPATIDTLDRLLSEHGALIGSDVRLAADPAEWSPDDARTASLLVHDADLVAVGPLASIAERLVDLGRRCAHVASKSGAVRWRFGGRRAVEEMYPHLARDAAAPETAHAVEVAKRALAVGAVAPPDAATTVTIWRSRAAELGSRLEQRLAESSDPALQSAPTRRAPRPPGSPTVDTSAMGDPTSLPTAIASTIEAVRLDDSLVIRPGARRYQLFGARFCVALRKVVLGDDMGLGKTFQALLVIGHEMAHGGTHAMVVCPASLIDNWCREAAKTINVAVARFHGDDRDEAWDSWRRNGGLLVTSYELATRVDPTSLVDLAVVIVDEAHLIKNPEAKRTIATAALIDRSRVAVLMTGTPLENRVEEFVSLVSHVQPELARSLSSMISDESRSAGFIQAVAGVYLRRNQSDVLAELPELIWSDEVFALDADPAYREAITAGSLMGARRVASVGSGASSPKMERLVDLADECRESGQKLLVFSYFRETLTTAISVLGDASAEIHGDVPVAQRQVLCDAFTAAEGFASLVLQIEAGGLGLNLQAASVVVIVEPQLKPSTEVQAVARAHRMGQTRRVTAYRFVADDTIEERLTELVAAKRATFDAFVRNSALKSASAASTDGGVDPEPAGLDVDPPIDEQALLEAEQRRLAS